MLTVPVTATDRPGPGVTSPTITVGSSVVPLTWIAALEPSAVPLLSCCDA